MIIKSFNSMLLLLIFLSCNQEQNRNNDAVINEKINQDTIIVKQNNIQKFPNQNEYSSKSLTYYQIVGNDTLDFVVTASENKSDSSINLFLNHENPMFLSDALKISLSLVNSDFDLKKMNFLYLELPIYYKDIAKELSADYEQKFGQKIVSSEKVKDFFLKSKMDKMINSYFNTFGIKTLSYSIEKFHLAKAQDWFLSNSITNYSDYPEFTFNGMGLHIDLKSID